MPQFPVSTCHRTVSHALRLLALLALILPLAGCPQDNGTSGPTFSGFSSITGLEDTRKTGTNLYRSNLRIGGTAFSYDVTFEALTNGQTITLDIDRSSGLTLVQAGFTSLPDTGNSATTVTVNVNGTSGTTTGDITISYSCADPDGNTTLVRHIVTLYEPPPVAVEFVMQPANYDLPGETMGTVTVRLKDEFDATTTNATNPITIALGDNPGSAGTLTGTLTMVPVSGVATFSDLDLDLTALGNDFTLMATASGLTSDESDPFDVTATGPVIFSIAPTIVRAGIGLVITGTIFSATLGNNTVTFDGAAATLNSGSTTELNVTVPDNVTAGDLVVVNSDAPSGPPDKRTSDGFTYVVAPFTANVDSDGDEVTGGDSDNPSLSADGQYVAFQSAATNLVDNDTNGQIDIFVRNNWTGAIERVSVHTDGSEAENGDSTNPAISDDGMKVVFQSTADNLIDDDSNGLSDIFLHDRSDGTTTRISVSTDGDQATAACTNPDISGDGLFAVFQSASTVLVDGKSFNGEDIFLRDLTDDTTEAVSVTDADGSLVSGDSTFPSINEDGQYIAFASTAVLATNDNNGSIDVYVRDRDSGNESTTLVSLDDSDNVLAAGLETGLVEPRSDISDDGMRVLFLSKSSALGGPAGILEVWMRDTSDDSTTLISRVSGGGAGGNQNSWFPRISGDGMYAAFASDATNLATGGDDDDIYHYDIDNQVTTRVSVDADGNEANAGCFNPALSQDGRAIGFSTDANNLVGTDTNGRRDVIVTSN